MTIAITVGDPSGVGPEVTLKALTEEFSADTTTYHLFGDPEQLHRLNQSLGARLPLVSQDESRLSDRVVVFATAHPKPQAPWIPFSSAAAQASMAGLRAAALSCLEGRCRALVTGPVCKEAIVDAGFSSFVGQTEFLSELAGTPDTVMMLLGCDDRERWLRVALATVHIPLRLVPERLTAARIDLAITRAAEACVALGLPRSRVAVCGLNPHAGEGGKLGDEEIRMIRPVVDAARRRGLDVTGPIPADTLFHFALRGDCDAVVAMYHDQGLAPLKMIGFETGVNWTLGLPFPRTSPDHGTAFEIAGRGIASAGSMLSALRFA
ncbi:MAG: 4-hydroxythreonine-4-phosphate dehydrogenase PdxA, partial [Verrucomicrobia bacterium]|nr:4-hydroxythreonine-4-phosphate dehydrogenase PdxA [Verrucomicrobiota bacterium]